VSVAPPSKSESLARDSREILISVAGEIFAERGYEATTIKEITDRAGVNVASVNYYFRDKVGLYTEVLRQCLHNGRLALPPDCAGLSPEERLTRYIHSFMNSLVAVGRPSWCGRLVVRELAQPTPALPQVIEEIIRPNFLLLRQLVSDVARFPLEEETLNLLTHGVHAQCVHWKTARSVFPYLWPGLRFDEAQVRRIASHIAAFSIAGIRATVTTEVPAL
jgi:TetR/AcrR family transcriptional regulator, regulator of cefoperazone and chloramphenicol sensitivity